MNESFQVDVLFCVFLPMASERLHESLAFDSDSDSPREGEGLVRSKEPSVGYSQL